MCKENPDFSLTVLYEVPALELHQTPSHQPPQGVPMEHEQATLPLHSLR